MAGWTRAAYSCNLIMKLSWHHLRIPSHYQKNGRDVRGRERPARPPGVCLLEMGMWLPAAPQCKLAEGGGRGSRAG